MTFENHTTSQWSSDRYPRLLWSCTALESALPDFSLALPGCVLTCTCSALALSWSWTDLGPACSALGRFQSLLALPCLICALTRGALISWFPTSWRVGVGWRTPSNSAPRRRTRQWKMCPEARQQSLRNISGKFFAKINVEVTKVI